MAVTNYHTVNGKLIGETSAGQRTSYLADALGSVTATADSAGAIVNTYRYKPYGGLLAKTGMGVDPEFLWTGNTGSRTTGLAHSGQYNRARHYSTENAQWLTVDPSKRGSAIANMHFLARSGVRGAQWAAYSYAGGSPTSNLDPLGLEAEPGGGGGGTGGCVTHSEGGFLFYFLEVDLELTVCGKCYDTRCCPYKASSVCVDLTETATVEFAWKDLDGVLGILQNVDAAFQQLERKVENYIGLFNLARCAFGRSPGCPRPDSRFSFRLCVFACAAFESLCTCAVYDGTPAHYEPCEKPDCFFPNAGLDFELEYHKCF